MKYFITNLHAQAMKEEFQNPIELNWFLDDGKNKRLCYRSAVDNMAFCIQNEVNCTLCFGTLSKKSNEIIHCWIEVQNNVYETNYFSGLNERPYVCARLNIKHNWSGEKITRKFYKFVNKYSN